MTTEAARRPRRVTDLTIHRTVIMCERDAIVVTADAGTRARASDCSYRTAPRFSITLQRFCISRLRIVMRRERIDRVDRLRDFPAYIGRHTGLLPKLVCFPNKAWPERSVACMEQIDLAGIA